LDFCRDFTLILPFPRRGGRDLFLSPLWGKVRDGGGPTISLFSLEGQGNLSVSRQDTGLLQPLDLVFRHAQECAEDVGVVLGEPVGTVNPARGL